MADIELVIKIPEEMWERVKEGYVPLGINKYLRDGTPLPECHGKLIDADKLSEEIFVIDAYSEESVKEQINDAPTVIPADKEE